MSIKTHTRVKKILLVLLYCSAFSYFSVAAHAQVIKVGIGTINYPPYYFKSDGIMKGAVIEITQHVAKQLGHTLVFEQYPWARIKSNLRLGAIDMVMIFFKTPEREEYALYTDVPYLYDESYLISRADSSLHFDGDLDLLNAYHFGHVRGYSHGHAYDEAVLLKHKAGDEKQLIRMLLKKRIDFAVGNKGVMSAHAKSYKAIDKIQFLNPPIDRAPVYFAFSKANKSSIKLVEQFSREIKQLLSSQKYRNIMLKYQLANE